MKRSLIVLFVLLLFLNVKSRALMANPNSGKCQGKFTKWRKSDFGDQRYLLGYNSEVFKATVEENPIVNFWIDVYTRYSTHHGIIHSLEYPEIVYEIIDFTDIDSDDSIKESKKEILRASRIKSTKERILYSLNKLADNDDPEAINSYDKKIIESFSMVAHPPTYREAADIKSIRFQLGQSDRMREAIQKSGRYLPMMEEIFKKEGLPKELTRIVFVESSFNVDSFSKVGASGLWQIMPYVAKGNLKINSHLDYRNHPIEATKLAAKILKFNFLNLGNWPLAVTAYNHGANGVKKLIELNHTKSLYKIIDSGKYTNSFGFASRNFYYSFIAALTVEKSAGFYFSDICKLSKIRMVEAVLPKPMKYKKFLEFFGGDSKLAYSFNPHFQKLIYSNRALMPKNAKVLIPESAKRGTLFSY